MEEKNQALKNNHPFNDLHTYYFYETTTEINHIQAILDNFSLKDAAAKITQAVFNYTYHQPFPGYFRHIKQDKWKKKADKAFIMDPTVEKKVQRKSHGAEHVSRVAVHSDLTRKLYEKFGTADLKNDLNEVIKLMPGDDKKTMKKHFVTLLKISAAFHDAGRYGDGPDKAKWEIEGAADCFKLITGLLVKEGFEQAKAEKIAERFAFAICGKDHPYKASELQKHLAKALRCKNDPLEIITAINNDNHRLMRRMYFSSEDDVTQDTLKDKIKDYKKDILKTLIHEGDVDDIMRCSTRRDLKRNFASRYFTQPRTRHFLLNFSDFYRDAQGERDKEVKYIVENKRSAAQAELIEMNLEWRDFISYQGDLHQPSPIEIELSSNGKKEKLIVSHGIKPHYAKAKKKLYEFNGISAVEGDLKNAEAHIRFPTLYEHFHDKKPPENAIATFLKPLDDALTARNSTITGQLDPLAIAIINLKNKLRSELIKNFKGHKMLTEITHEDIEGTQFINVPNSVFALLKTLNGTSDDQAKIDALDEFVKVCDPIINKKSTNIASALAFVIIAAIGIIVGATIGAVLGALTGVVAGPLGAAAGAAAGFIVGATLIAKHVHFKKSHEGINENLNEIFKRFSAGKDKALEMMD